MKITIDYILSREPCYTREELEEMFAGRAYVHWRTVIKEAKPQDAIWLLCHTDFIPEKKLHLLGCDFAEHTELKKAGKALVQLKCDWVAGKVTDEELEKAKAADWAAYCAAHRAAAWAANRAADYKAERKWQLEQIVKAIKEMSQ